MKNLIILILSLLMVGCSEEKQKTSEELYQEYQLKVKEENINKTFKTRVKSGDINFDEALNLYFKSTGWTNSKIEGNEYKIKLSDGHYYKLVITDIGAGYYGYGYMGMSHDPECEMKDIEKIIKKYKCI